MSALITLSPADWERLRDDGFTWAEDGDGMIVLLFVSGSCPAVVAETLRVELSARDVELIAEPDDLGVADVSRTTGWTVRVERP